MKKIFYYLIFLIILGGAVVSFWVYEKYFKEDSRDIIYIDILKGDIDEIVRARGEVVTKKEFNLEFPFFEKIDKVYVSKGDKVKKGSMIMSVNSDNFKLELDALNSKLKQAEANLTKLQNGPTKEDLRVLEDEVKRAEQALKDAEVFLINTKSKAKVDIDNLYGDVFDILNDAWIKSDDAINKQIYPLFNESEFNNFSLVFNVTNQSLKTKVEQDMVSVKNKLLVLRDFLNSLNHNNENLDNALAYFQNELNFIRSFLFDLSSVLDDAIGIDDVSLDTYKTSVNLGRTNVNLGISAINNQIQLINSQKIINNNSIFAAESKINTLSYALKLAKNNLAAKKSGARQEDIDIAKAQIEEIKSKINVVKNNIKKSVLYSPENAIVTNVLKEEGELAGPGIIVISLADLNYKIQSDISELDIDRIKVGDSVLVVFDAFEDKEFTGKVTYIDKKEKIKNDDKYYSIDVELNDNFDGIRLGLSADLKIKILSKNNVIKIPEFVVNKKNNKYFVNILDNGEIKDREVVLGVSDGDYVEVVSGLDISDSLIVIAN